MIILSPGQMQVARQMIRDHDLEPLHAAMLASYPEPIREYCLKKYLEERKAAVDERQGRVQSPCLEG